MATETTGIGEPVHGEGAGAVPWYRQTLAFARRTVRELFRNRSALFWGLAMPVFFYVVFGLGATGGGGATTGRTRAASAVAYGVFGAFSVSLVIFAGSLSADVRSKRYRKLRSLPVSPSADVIGRFLGGFAMATASFLLVLAVGAATGATLAVRSYVSVAVVLVAFFLFCLLAMAMAVFVASLMDDSEYIVGVTNMLLLGLFFLTGYNGLVPSVAPGPLTTYVNFAPNALATRLIVYHLAPVNGGGVLSPPGLPTDPRWLGLLVAYAVGVGAVASWVMHRRIYSGDGGE